MKFNWYNLDRFLNFIVYNTNTFVFICHGFEHYIEFNFMDDYNIFYDNCNCPFKHNIMMNSRIEDNFDLLYPIEKKKEL